LKISKKDRKKTFANLSLGVENLGLAKNAPATPRQVLEIISPACE